jgi:hypothetical protein
MRFRKAPILTSGKQGFVDPPPRLLPRSNKRARDAHLAALFRRSSLLIASSARSELRDSPRNRLPATFSSPWRYYDPCTGKAFGKTIPLIFFVERAPLESAAFLASIRFLRIVPEDVQLFSTRAVANLRVKYLHNS